MHRRTMLALGGSAVAAGLMPPFARAAEMDKVAVQLDWVIRGDHAMFFVARQKGYFKQNNIDVFAIRRGTGTPDALRLVASGSASFGFGDLPTLIVSRSHGVPDVAVVAVNQRSPLAMISIAKRHKLARPQDLKGLNIGVHPAGSTYIFLKAFLDANGMSLADIKQSTVSPPYENYLVLGRVDAVPGYLDAEVPVLEAKTGGPGSLSILQGADWGFHAYGSGVFTSEDLIRKDPGLVQRFVSAYMLAFRDVIADPAGAVDAIIADNPEYKDQRTVLLAQLQADIKGTFFSPTTKADGIGTITATQWTQTVETLKSQGELPKSAPATGGFDDRFVKAANPIHR